MRNIPQQVCNNNNNNVFISFDIDIQKFIKTRGVHQVGEQGVHLH